MLTLPNLHDGFLDGVFLSEDKSAHLFVRTVAGERSTIVLKGIKAMNVTNFWAGNIILDVTVVHPERLSGVQIQNVYPYLSKEDNQVAAQLSKAQQQGLFALEITPSYGAEGTFLFASAEILPAYVFPQLGA